MPITIVQPSTIAPDSFVDVQIPSGWGVWTVRYKGIDRQERWTIVYREEGKTQEHVVRKGLQEFTWLRSTPRQLFGKRIAHISLILLDF